jgi:hypothetical protein
MSVCEFDWIQSVMRVHFFEPYNFAGLRSLVMQFWNETVRSFVYSWIKSSWEINAD